MEEFDLDSVEIPKYLEDYINVQQNILSITEDGVDNFIKWLETNFLCKPDNAAFLAKEIAYAQTIRPNIVKYLVAIVSMAFNNLYYGEKFMKELVIAMKQYQSIQLLHELLLENYIQAEDLDDFPNFQKALKEIEESEEEDYDKLRIADHWPEGSIGYIIENDDVTSLQRVFLDPHFNPSILIKVPIFHPFINLTKRIRLMSLAALSGSPKCFKYLMLQKLPIDDEVAKYAICGGSIEIVRLCEQNKAVFLDGLELAAVYHRQDILSWLMTKYQVHNLSAFECLRSRNYKALIYILEENWARVEDIDFRGMTIADRAASTNEYPILRYLKNLGASVHDEFGSEALYEAVREHSKENTLLLLEMNAPLNKKHGKEDFSPLHLAAANGDLEIVSLLIDFGAKLEKRTYMGETPLHVAVKNGQIDAVQLLIASGSDKEAKTSQGRTVLQMAISGLHFETARVIVEAGAEVNTEDGNGWNAVCYAAELGNVKVVEYLLKKGGEGRMALDVAVENGHSEAAEMISKYMRDSTDSTTRTADLAKMLVDASRRGSVENVRMLLGKGADPNGRYNGQTALHAAAAVEAIPVLKLLIEAGADVSAKDGKGLLAHQLAKTQKTKKLLKPKGNRFL